MVDRLIEVVEFGVIFVVYNFVVEGSGIAVAAVVELVAVHIEELIFQQYQNSKPVLVPIVHNFLRTLSDY